MLTSFRLILYNQSVKILYIISNLKCQSFWRKKYQPFFVSILKNYWKLNFFSSIWVSIWISNMIRIETAILSLNEVSMDFKLENRKSGQISLLYIPFWAKSRIVHFDPSISYFWRAGNCRGSAKPLLYLEVKFLGKCLHLYSLTLKQYFAV